MIGIASSPERIRTAPPEVRRWLQREIAGALDFRSERQGAKPETEHLVIRGPEEVAAIYAAIRGMPPGVGVFFELGREGDSLDPGGVEAYRLVDMLHHARLRSIEQLDACLGIIDEAVRAVRNDPGATLYVLDPSVYCLIATATRAAILAPWRRLAAGQSGASVGAAGGAEAAGVRPAAPVFPEVSATMPAGSAHSGEAGVDPREG